jgi:hypothetical protein
MDYQMGTTIATKLGDMQILGDTIDRFVVLEENPNPPPAKGSFVNSMGAGPGNDVCAYMQDISYTPKTNVRGLEAPHACNTGNRNRQTQYL